jgi:hypothetical protein
MDVPEIDDHGLRLEFTFENHFYFCCDTYIKIQYGDITLDYAYSIYKKVVPSVVDSSPETSAD